jgi:hypothetical protein
MPGIDKADAGRPADDLEGITGISQYYTFYIRHNSGITNKPMEFIYDRFR